MKITAAPRRVVVMLALTMITMLLNGTLVLVQSGAPQGAPPQGSPGGAGRGGGLGNGATPVAYDDYTGFTKLFDGQTFAGWNGESDVWSIDNGAIHANTVKTPGQHHLHYTGPNAVMRDFDLKVEFRISATGANGGIQYRSRLLMAPHKGSIDNPLGAPMRPDLLSGRFDSRWSTHARNSRQLRRDRFAPPWPAVSAISPSRVSARRSKESYSRTDTCQTAAGAAARFASIWAIASTTASKVSIVEACRAL